MQRSHGSCHIILPRTLTARVRVLMSRSLPIRRLALANIEAYTLLSREDGNAVRATFGREEGHLALMVIDESHLVSQGPMQDMQVNSLQAGQQQAMNMILGESRVAYAGSQHAMRKQPYAFSQKR